MRLFSFLLALTVVFSFSALAQPDSTCYFRTQTQGGWGSTPHGNNPGTYVHANFDTVFPNGLIVGCAGGDSLTLTSAQAVTDYLPGGGSPDALSGSLVDPTNYKNNLASQLVALTLTAYFDQADTAFGTSSTSILDATIATGTFAGWTVQMLLDTANAVLGGCNSNYSYSDLSGALASINESFVDGTPVDTNLLVCDTLTTPPPPPPTCSVALNFVADTVCLGDSTTITNLSTGVDSLGVYEIDFGSDGTIDVTDTAYGLPTDTTVLFAAAGVYSFTVYVTNPDSCADTLTGTIVVSDVPSLMFTTDTVCLGSPTTITNLSTGVDSMATYYLDLNNDGNVELTAMAGDLPTDTMITIPFLGTTTFSVVVENPGGCTDTMIGSIVVYPPDSCLGPRLSGGNFILEAGPNPTAQNFIMQFDSETDDDVRIDLFAADGKRIAVLFNGNVEAGIQYKVNTDVSHLPYGIYYIRAISPNGVNVTRRIVHLD